MRDEVILPGSVQKELDRLPDDVALRLKVAAKVHGKK